MKRLIVALLVAAVLSATIWGLTAALPLTNGTAESGSNNFSNGWNSTGFSSLAYFGPP